MIPGKSPRKTLFKAQCPVHFHVSNMANSKNWVFKNRQFSKKNYVNFKDCSWTSRIDWCQGHWPGSTYIIVRQCGISAKRALKHQKCIWAISLLQIQGPISKNSTKFLRIQGFWKTQLFFSWPFWTFFSKNEYFIFIRISQRFLDIKDESKFW